MDPQVKEVLTLGIAIVGAGLGIFNAYISFDQRRVRIRVIPKLGRLKLENGQRFEVQRRVFP